MSRVRSDDLVVLTTVARHRTFSAAARELGLDHTTVARRLQALSTALGGRLLVESPGGWDLTPLGRSASDAGSSIEATLDELAGSADQRSTARLRGVVRLSAPEAFVVQVVTSAVAALAGQHPELSCEVISATRPLPQHGPSNDLDIGVTRPRSRRLEVRELASYRLALFAARSYVDARPPIRARADLRDHCPVFYVESMLQVADLDLIDQFFPQRRRLIGATSVLAQVALVRAGAGVGLLPSYLAEPHSDLVAVLPHEVGVELTYWMTSRPANLRRPEVTAVADAISHGAARLRW
ncbi:MULTISPECIES: LysR family transcriptional regulator [unclassified Nocardioides]|uniref:LysR family transcriptional regulator n=1 Tax=unclassified Nocardioides TaxID=2615069 RepID=UPI00138EF2FC|nr:MULTISPECIES: LysR family transcriptional regulator [unclassified Nocardioides]